MFDVTELTLDTVSKEIEGTLKKLERLTALQVAMQAQDNRRVKQLIDEYNEVKRIEEKR